MWCRLSCYSQVYTFEAKYVEDLRILSQVYLEPVEARLDIWRNEGPNSIQKQRKWNSLNQYSNALHALYEMHSNGLERNTEIAKQHHGRRNSSSGYAVILDALKMYRSFIQGDGLKNVAEYMNRMPQVQQLISRRSKVDPILHGILQAQQNSLPKGGLTMQAYMISTLQSITSYAMLLERLLENLDVHHPAYAETQALHSDMIAFNQNINATKRNYDRLLNLQGLMPDFPINLAKESRQLLRHEKLQSIADLDCKVPVTCPVAVILLTDMCIVCNYQELTQPDYQECFGVTQSPSPQSPSPRKGKAKPRLLYSAELVLY